MSIKGSKKKGGDVTLGASAQCDKYTLTNNQVMSTGATHSDVCSTIVECNNNDVIHLLSECAAGEEANSNLEYGTPANNAATHIIDNIIKKNNISLKRKNSVQLNTAWCKIQIQNRKKCYCICITKSRTKDFCYLLLCFVRRGQCGGKIHTHEYKVLDINSPVLLDSKFGS